MTTKEALKLLHEEYTLSTPRKKSVYPYFITGTLVALFTAAIFIIGTPNKQTSNYNLGDKCNETRKIIDNVVYIERTC